MGRDYLKPELCRRGINQQEIWFQQDGAPAHTAHVSMGDVHRLFQGHVISCFGDVNSPPLSPDLSVCDYFLWGYMKSRVYTNKLRTYYQRTKVV